MGLRLQMAEEAGCDYQCEGVTWLGPRASLSCHDHDDCHRVVSHQSRGQSVKGEGSAGSELFSLHSLTTGFLHLLSSRKASESLENHPSL